MYLYSAALGVVVGLKESRRHGADLESPGFEDVQDPVCGLLTAVFVKVEPTG
jgi:hypothetical protein